jgi:hypothetical protein
MFIYCIFILVIRNLAALPVPPRSVIIERLPAAPAKPRMSLSLFLCDMFV